MNISLLIGFIVGLIFGELVTVFTIAMCKAGETSNNPVEREGINDRNNDKA